MDLILIPGLHGGLNTGLPRNLIDVSESPKIQNFIVDKGVLTKRTGYAAAGGSTPPDAQIQHLHYYYEQNGAKKRMWAFEQDDIKWSASYGGNWTRADSGGDPSGKQTGTDHYWCTTEIVRLSDLKTYLCFLQQNTNPEDPEQGDVAGRVHYVNDAEASGASGVTILGGATGYNTSATYHRCKWMLEYGNRLCLYNIVWDSSGDKLMPTRIQWSAQGSFTVAGDWSSTAFGDLRTGAGAIVRAELLRNTAYVYMEHSIISQNITNDSSAPFRFDTMVPEVGLYSVRLLVNTGDAHYFVGNNRQIYEYFGGRDLRPIGDPIKEEFFNDIDKTFSTYRRRNRSFGVYFRDLNAVGFVIPVDTTDPDIIYVYFFRTRRWFKFNTQHAFQAFAEYLKADGVTGGYENIPYLAGVGSGTLYQWDYNTANDAGTAIDAYVQTKDFLIDLKHKYAGINVYFEASGDGAASTVVVGYSPDDNTDPDSGWTEKTVTLTSGWDLYKANFNLSGYMAKFQFRNAVSGEKLKLGSIRIELERMDEEK
tara:strand:- start:4055 stop:5659 length:1605 start_codon:yes stop_codon:yes gene_type:complete